MSAGQPLLLRQWVSMHTALYWAYEGAPSHVRSVDVVTSQTAWLLRRGKVRLAWRGRTVTVSAGQWAIFGGDRGQHRFTAGARLLSICFRAEWFTGKPFFDDASPIIFDAAGCPALERASNQLVKTTGRFNCEPDTALINRPSTFPQYLRLHKAYCSWLEALTRALDQAGVAMQHIGPSDERVLHAVRLLDKWPMQRPFDERELAATVGLSRTHLNRLLAVELGLSAKAYFERRRFAAARERLLADNTPIKTVTYLLGFHDTAHFSNWFRQRTGVSPMQFRTGKAKVWQLT